MQEIKKIVITGGPCGGKTTSKDHIYETFTALGYKVLFIGESATELISGGVAPWTCGTNAEFQKIIIKYQLEKEALFEKAAKSMPEQKILIVCDRGAFDNRAYMNDTEYAEVKASLGFSDVELRDNYDAVFHLVTAANGAEAFYTTANNEARIEGIMEAKKLDERIISAWTGHPHLRVIDNSTDFKGKMHRLVDEVKSALGENGPFEIERKFLIEYPDLSLLDSIPWCHKTDIIQTYLKSENGEQLRIRQKGEDGSYVYFKTIKRKLSPVKRIEIESRITEKEYLSLLINADPNYKPICKNRYCITYMGQYFELDVYPFWTNKAVIELEMTEENKEIVFPDFIKVIKEVTDDPAYGNYSMARVKI